MAGRREDRRLVTGAGRYVDDLAPEGAVHAAFLRSPHAHARVRALDASGAGALLVLSAEDIAGLDGLHPYQDRNLWTGEPFPEAEPQPLLARDRVRHVGQPVAVAVAETPAGALDAAERIAVDYEILEPAGEEILLDTRAGDPEAVAAAFAAAAHRVRIELLNHRVVVNPMEPRGAVASWDGAAGRWRLDVSGQNLHGNRDMIVRALRAEPGALRLVAGDVGGGFGAKNFAYPEYPVLLEAARRLGRPVRWTASRSETFLADHQSRGQRVSAELALDAEGRFLALAASSTSDAGAWSGNVSNSVQTGQYVHLAGALYDIPAIALEIRAARSHAPPEGVTRGPGFAEMVNLCERLVEKAGRETGLGAARLRRLNIRARGPFVNALGFTVDSGDFRAALAEAEALAEGFADRRRASGAAGLLRGLGVAVHVKGTGGSPEENVELRFAPDGPIDLVTGTQHIGQGHETTFPEIVARRLGVPAERIRLVQGDTDLIAKGGGHGSSRATYMAGTAIVRAAAEALEKGRRLAAERLEAAEADIEYADGVFAVAGTDRRAALEELAGGGALDSYHCWTREWMTFPSGVHVCEVEVDPETGRVRLDRYGAVDDYGERVDDEIVLGQVHGAIAQGVGQALLEEAVLEPGTGQPLAGSFMDYAMPRADDLPSFSVALRSTPCATNPLGVKGCGESGAVAGYPAVTNAILDALAPLGVTGFEGAATPFRIWESIRRARSAGPG